MRRIKKRGIRSWIPVLVLGLAVIAGCASVNLTVNFNEVRNTIAALVAASDAEWLYIDEPNYVIVIEGSPRYSESYSYQENGTLIAQSSDGEGSNRKEEEKKKRSLDELDLGDLEVTPELKAALQRQHARSDAVSNAKYDGLIGENIRGYLSILVDNPAEDLQELVEAENEDRRLVVDIVMEQYGLTSENDQQVIERLFYEERYKVARIGDWVQTPEGEWVQAE